MKNEKNGRTYLVLTILWMMVIFFFSSQDGGSSNLNNLFVLDLLKKIGMDAVFIGANINFIIRKMAHFTEYFILGMLLYMTFKAYLLRYYMVASIVAGFLYACTDEFHQYFVPQRTSAFTDVIIDTSGVFAGVIIISLFYLVIWTDRRKQRIQG